ncbi:hypothetical protein Skr01_72670 [Sphaerisporangium krabiense]|uniref:Predicted membrane protein YciQ-like C-terminal domain-containing protein n=1 Tax=Sphaerisporangium krabiense TaxID=763782 RepID=A0A7W8Z6Y8_9ACTN|nr:DUF2207 domain-containing protein [Sphaerisporangium krabiense]MBB5628541.1 hypothetical protein [Sphaerisporangium krabiense]GII67182.1 hypothetical protein Skr01_72670 [Sphaerisporangium krabiense]
MVFFVAAAVAAGLWLLLLAALAAATRTPAVVPGPATAELREESPALVGLITGGVRLGDEAVAATLLDLAARGAVQIEEIGPELSLVRLRVPGTPLRPYEKLVYDHVRSLATDGVVATGALAEGSRNLGRWWKSFRKKVIAEAREKGLSRPRWNRVQAAVLTAAAAVPAGALGVAVSVTTHSSSSDGDGGFAAAVLGFGALVALMGRLNGERGTAEGARVAGYWMGVRAHLAAGEGFAERPAAAVTIWGRHLAYAAALGLAGRAVASLPIGRPADDRRAWSDFGGMWHVVTVTYPRRFLWGRPPGPIVFAALAAAFFCGFWTWLLGVVGSAVFDWPGSLNLPVAVLAAGLTAGVPIYRVLADLTTKAEAEGQIVRLRRFRVGGDDDPKYAYWLALDDGRTREVKAYGIAEELWRPLAEGDLVRARVGRRTGWVEAVEVLTGSRHRGAASYDDTGEHLLEAPENLGEVSVFGAASRRRDEEEPGGPASLVTPADLRRALGVPFGPAGAWAGDTPMPPWLAVRSCRYEATGATPVTVDVHAAAGPRAVFLIALGGTLSREKGRPVPGMGGRAMLYPGVVAARTSQGAFAVHVRSPAGPPPPGALIGLARAVVARAEGTSPVA